MQVSSFNSLNEIFFLQCEKYQKEYKSKNKLKINNQIFVSRQPGGILMV